MAEVADVVVSSGRGSFVYDSGGRGYLDTVAGYGVASIGHSDPAWVDAVITQARRLAVTPLYTEELGRYLEALAGILPSGLGQIALCSTGAEAVEMAVRLSQTASDRPDVLTFGNGFHGKTAAVRYASKPDTAEAQALGPPWLRSTPYPACQHDPCEYLSCGDSGAEAIAAITSRDDLARLGTVLVEPVLGTAGNIPPERGFLRALRELCDEHGWLLVFDESITGLGRTGTLFAFEHFDAQPDVLVLGKGLGGGLPFSAVCASPELWNDSALASPSSTSSSFGGNPLACAAGLATLRILTRDGFLENVRSTSQDLSAGLCELAATSSSVAWARGLGLMLGFDHVDPISGDLADEALCGDRFRASRDRGVLLAAHSPRIRINPPLTLTPLEADRLLAVLFEVFK
ncbi:MAG TPA: aspartate aminotransferase family protein [Solirubrobacterales bacterium]|jgi:4-aminobutyrate aminotransferase-like enzyme|nr:aspartate aminotransferase family protein [Solirubrobacterales bacterium]